jgi:hypothetical protein
MKILFTILAATACLICRAENKTVSQLPAVTTVQSNDSVIVNINPSSPSTRTIPVSSFAASVAGMIGAGPEADPLSLKTNLGLAFRPAFSQVRSIGFAGWNTTTNGLGQLIDTNASGGALVRNPSGSIDIISTEAGPSTFPSGVTVTNDTGKHTDIDTNGFVTANGGFAGSLVDTNTPFHNNYALKLGFVGLESVNAIGHNVFAGDSFLMLRTDPLNHQSGYFASSHSPIGIDDDLGQLYGDIGGATNLNADEVMPSSILDQSPIAATNLFVDYRNRREAAYSIDLSADAYFVGVTNDTANKHSQALFRLLSGSTNRWVSWNTNFVLLGSYVTPSNYYTLLLASNHSSRFEFENYGLGNTNCALRVYVSQAAVATSGGGCTAANIASQPSDTTVLSNTTAYFNVYATGTEPISYQWYQGSVNLAFGGFGVSGTTTSNLVLTGAATDIAGSGTPYHVVLSNACSGSITSSLAFLYITNGASGGGGTLTNGLVANWTLDEASGTTRVDDWGGNDLTDEAGNVTSVTGTLGNAAHYIGGGSSTLSHADNAALSFTGRSFTIGVDVNMASLTTDQFILGKWGATGEYIVYYDHTAQRFIFYRRNAAGTTTSSVSANTFGAPSSGTAYYLICGQDFENSQLFISVNAGTTDTTAFADDGRDDTLDFTVGQFDTGGSVFNGDLDQIDIWSRTLSGTEKTDMYNGGALRNPVANP